MKKLLPFFLLPLFFWACIGDDVLEDFVEPELRILNTIDSLSIDSTHLFGFRYFNNVGSEEAVSPVWSSSDDNIATVDANGMVTAVGLGPVDITASYDDGENPVFATTSLHTAENPVIIVDEPETRSGDIRTTSSYVLEGSFTITEQEDGSLLLSIGEDYRATQALPDLFLYLSNNPNSIGNALVVADVDVYNGAHEYIIPNVGIDQYSHLLYYCRPFNVKVGDGEIVEE